MHVYDLRSRKYLGLTKTIEADIIPCRATFFALTPAEAQPAELTLEPAGLERGALGSAKIRGQAAQGLAAVLVTAKTPDGKEADWLRRMVMVPPEGASVPLPVAFNDPQGNWKLTATELYSNKSTEQTLAVR